MSVTETEGHYDDHKFSLGKQYRHYNEQWHLHTRSRYVQWIFATFFTSAVIFFVPWVSMNGFNNPLTSTGFEGGIINDKGYTGDFMQSSIASFAIMINIYHILIFIYTRHFNAIIVSVYIYSGVVYLVMITLDNIESFPQTNLFMFFGSWIFPLSVLCGTSMVGIPMYALKCWEMAISAP